MDFFEALPKLLEQPLLIVLLVFMLMALGIMAWAMRAQSALYSEAPAKMTNAIDQAVKTVVGIYQKMLDESQQQIADMRNEITQIKETYARADEVSKRRISELERQVEELSKKLTAVTNERDSERIKFAKERAAMEVEIDKLRGEVAALKHQLEATGKAALGLLPPSSAVMAEPPPILPMAGVEPPKESKPDDAKAA